MTSPMRQAMIDET